MDDEADVNKMIEVLKNSKQEDMNQFQYEGFINYDDNDSDIEECFNEDSVDDLEELVYPDNISSLNLKSLYKYNPVSSLKPEEKQIIDSCTDPELKKILILNRQKNMQLIQLYKKNKDLLIECKQNILEKNEIIKHCKENKNAKFAAGIWRLGAPYFKDRQLYCCPSNEDTLRKRRNQELSIYDIIPSLKWSSHECDMLTRAIKVNYNINQQNEVRRKIKEVTSSGGDKEELAELTARLEELNENDNSEIPPLNSDKNINWSRVAEVFIRDKHSSFECRSVWHAHLHPSFNKGPWTAAENAKLQDLVRKYKRQHWDKIAKELGTNRSCFAACSHYFSNLQCKFKKGEFTTTEDRKLLEFINKYRMGSFIPWVNVAQHFKNRTRSQLHHRYTYYLSQHHKKIGKFSEAEDILIMICVDKFGKNFKKCTEFLPDRSLTQIKARYSSNLKNFVKKGTWTVEEDRMIMNHVEKYGATNWMVLTKKISRSRGQLRQRYNVVKAFLNENPDASIEDVRRRKHNWSMEQQEFMFLRVIADKYQNKPVIPTVKAITKQLKLLKRKGYLKPNKELAESDWEAEDFDSDAGDSESCDSDFDIPDTKNIDDLLTDFFSNCYKVGAEPKLTPKSLNDAVDDMEVLIDVLKVDLDIPEELRETSRLDGTDVDILTELRRRRPGISTRGRNVLVRELVPPNLHSAVGMWSLLIKNLHFKGMCRKFHMYPRSSVSRIRFDITKDLSDMNAEEKSLMEADRRLFYRRFYSLFKWPSLMTLEGPSPELKNITESMKEEIIRPPVKRTYSRMNRSIKPNVPAEKRPKLTDLLPPPPPLIQPGPSTTPPLPENDSRPSALPRPPEVQSGPSASPLPRDIQSCSSTSPPQLVVQSGPSERLPPPVTQPGPSASPLKRDAYVGPSASPGPLNVQPGPSTSPLKLTPVTNKSVIENLMKDRNKKLFYFNEVQCGEKTKTVIKEVKLNLVGWQNKVQKPVTNGRIRPIPKLTSTVTSNSPSHSYTTKNNYVGVKSSQKSSFETCPRISAAHKFPKTETDLETDFDAAGECSRSTTPSSSVTDDAADLAKLDSLLMGRTQSKTQNNCDSDLYDLEKLNIFLKGEMDDSDSDSEMSFTL